MPLTSEEQNLWFNIKRFEIDDYNSEFTFSQRLARENKWSYDYALRAIHEYKKFMFLVCISNHPLTPSDQVDQVWHLHLIYTESYWIEFCKKTINRIINHGPTKGGNHEKSKYNDWYSKTKDLYEAKFDSSPPDDLWPSSDIRFKEINFGRVNFHTNWVIPKPRFFKKWKF